jgi:outer membrane protein insertion porin family
MVVRFNRAAFLALGILAAMATTVTGTALAQQRAPAAVAGGTVTGIRIEGNTRVEVETVRSYIELREGQPYDPSAADRSLRALYGSGLFQDVTLTRDGGTVVVKVVENPILNRVVFEGNRKLEDDTLRPEVQSRPRLVFTRARTQSDVRRLLDVYRRNGRYNATIEPKIIRLDQNRVDLVFEINEGDVTAVKRISFVGNERFSDGTLRGRIRTVETAWWRFLTSEDRYDPDRINFDRELLRKFYLSEGYADFRVVSVVAELTPERDGFFVTFTISEGERYKFGKVDVSSKFEGLDVDSLKRLVTTREGDWYNSDEVEATITAIAESVGTLGYAFVDVRPEINRNAQDLTIDITYDVQEGPRVYVERINITGNTRTLDKVIRREFRLAEGDAFNTAKLRRSQQRIRGLGFFEKVDMSTTQGSSADKTVIEVNVVEQSTGEISFGAGYSSQAGLLGDVSLRERNLLGKGQDLRLGLSVGTRSSQLDFSFTEPYFLDRNIAAGVDAFYITTDQTRVSSFDERTAGFALRAGWSLSDNLRHTVRYTFRYDKIFHIEENASNTIKNAAGTTYTSEIGQVFLYDLRDNRFIPTKGYFIRLSTDLGGLGGTEHYARAKIDGGYYYSIIEDFVLAFLGSAGIIEGIKDDVKLANRYFLGGDNLRGFRAGGVGPHDGGDALGGRYFWVTTAELTFPLGLPREFGLAGKAFVDVGSLWEADTSGPTIIDKKSPRVGAGFGIAWQSPFGPIRVDYAWALKKAPQDKTEHFRFSFGTRF